MSWEDILKRGRGFNKADMSILEYVMKDGVGRTGEEIIERIYEEIEINKGLSSSQRTRKGRPHVTRFGTSQQSLKSYLRQSPDYENERVENKLGRKVYKFTYVGE